MSVSDDVYVLSEEMRDYSIADGVPVTQAEDIREYAIEVAAMEADLLALRVVADAAAAFVVEWKKGERQIDFFHALVRALEAAGR